MRTKLTYSCVSLFLAHLSLPGFAASVAKSRAETITVRFADVDYFHRWSKDDQHEFTPKGQEDLARWSDMVTIHYYPTLTDGEGLASAANSIVENYKALGAKVLRTNSVPRTKDKPAEHLIVVLFPRPDFIEAVFARFKFTDGIGSSVIYSHREHGKKIGNEMSAWLQKHGPPTEKSLMSWDAMPSPDAFKK